MKKNNTSYQGNSNLKKRGVVETYTEEQVKEILKCKFDPIYFIENYIHIINLDDGLIKFKLYDYQKRLIKMLHENKRIIGKCPRQVGKSITVSAYFCHYVIFNDNKTTAILGNKDKTARELLYKIKIMFENLPNWLKPGVEEWNKGSVEFENGSRIVTAATSSSAIRGMSINCVPDYTKVCVMLDNEDIYYTTIKKATDLEVINSIESKLIKEEQVDTMNIKHKKEFYTVYKITNLINQKEYIGFHSTDDLKDGYLGSGKIIKRAIEKYKPENFIKEYIEIFDNKDDAEKLEAELVNEKYVRREDTYNISLGGNVCILFGVDNGFYGKHHTENTKKIISGKNTGKKHTEEALKKISSAGIKNWGNDEFRKKMEKRTPRQFTEEQKIKHSEVLSGRKFTEDHCKNISESKLDFYNNLTDEEYEEWYNSTFTEESNKKRSKKLKGKSHPWQDKINKNPDKIRKTAEANIGSKRTEESKLKMSLAKKGKRAHNKGKVYCYNPITLLKKFAPQNNNGSYCTTFGS